MTCAPPKRRQRHERPYPVARWECLLRDLRDHAQREGAPMNPIARARARYITLAMLSPLCLLGLWVLATSQGWVKSVLLPPPQAVLASLIDMVTQG